MKKFLAFISMSVVFALPVVLLTGSVVGQAVPDKKTGSYSSAVNSPPGVDGVAWVITGGDVENIKVSFVADIPCGSRVFVQVRDDVGQIGSGKNDPVTFSDAPCDLGDVDDPQVVDLDDPSLADVAALDITVTATITGPPGVKITEVVWIPDPDDIRQVKTVDVTFDNIPGGVKSLKAHISLKDSSGNLLKRVEDLVIALSVPDDGSLTWDLSSAGSPGGTIAAKDIYGIDIQVVQAKKK